MELVVILHVYLIRLCERMAVWLERSAETIINDGYT